MATQGSGAHRKGSNRERDIAKKLSKWSGEEFLRTLSSGAGGNKATQGQTQMIGDIFPPLNSKCPFTFEVKDHKSSRLRNVFLNNSTIQSFWEQATSDCRRLVNVHKSPVLLFRVDREDTYVLLPYTKKLENFLNGEQLPCQVQKIFYKDKMTGYNYEFDTLLTNLKAFTQTDVNWLYKVYKNVKWDKYNQEEQPNKDIDVDTLIEGSLD